MGTPIPAGRQARRSIRTVRSTWRRYEGSASISIATIFPDTIVKLNTTRGCLPGAQTAPVASSMSASCAAPWTSGGNVIKYIPDQAIVGLNAGDLIRLTADQFERLSAALFVDLEAKFVEQAAPVR
jgi:hypothetical protein